MTWLDGVRGKPPTKTGTWACLFARRGGKIFAAPPGLLNSPGANVRRWARCLKISNFCEIEFSVRAATCLSYGLTISPKLKPKISTPESPAVCQSVASFDTLLMSVIHICSRTISARHSSSAFNASRYVSSSIFVP